MKNYFKLLVALAVIQSCRIAYAGSVFMDSKNVDVVATALSDDLAENSPPSFARGRGPVDSDYKLYTLLTEICGTHITPSDATVMIAQIRKEQHRSIPQSRVNDVIRAVTALASEKAPSADVRALLASEAPGVRAIGCFLAGNFGMKDFISQLTTIAARDPYILVQLDSRNAVVFVAPVREQATRAVSRLGLQDGNSSVDVHEGLAMLQRFFVSRPELRREIESLIESALKSSFHSEDFRRALRDFSARKPQSATPDDIAFLLTCQKLADEINTFSPDRMHEWPRDSDGNPLPAPPTRP